MVKRNHLIEKLPVKPYWKIRPCRDPECNISTNKRYRGPNGAQPVVACMFSHAEQAVQSQTL